MTPRSTAFGLLALLVVVCGIGLLFLRGAQEMEATVLETREAVSKPTEEIPVPPTPEGSDAPLHGFVLDAAGRTVDGARVRLVSLAPDRVGRRGRIAWIERVTSDADDPDVAVEAAADGAYEFETLLPGRYGIRAEAPGHAGTFEVVAIGQTPIRRDLALVEERTIEGAVVDAASGDPVPDAHVLALRVPSVGTWRGGAGENFLREPRAHARAARDGTFRIDGLLTGRYEVVAIREGFARAIRFADADAKHVVLELTAGTSLVGMVSGPDGTPVAGAEIGVFREDLTVESGARSARDGTYRVEGLSPGSKTVAVRAPGRRPFRRTDVAVAVGAETTLDIVLETGASVSGHVVDGEGRAVEGAVVLAFPYSGAPPPPVSTDADGAFTCAGLPRDRLLLRVEKDGYGREERVEVQAGQRGLEIVLLRSGRLLVRVTSTVTDGPLTTYRVKAYRQDTDLGLTVRARLTAPWRRVADAPGGAHEVEDLRPGDYTVEIEANDHGPGKAENVSVPAGGASEVVEIALDAGAVLSGRVLVAGDDAPVAGATVSVNVLVLNMPITKSEHATTTDGDGAFRLEALPPGEVSITIVHPDHAGHVTTATATVEDGEPILVRLPAGAIVHGTVYDEAGRPVPAARIIARPTSAQVLTEVTDTGADGRYRFERLPPGPMMLMWQIDAQQARIRMKQLVLEPGGDREVDFHAAGEGAVLSGIVRNADGPVVGAIVALLPMGASGETGPSMRTGRTDDDGRYRLRGIVAGRYLLSIADGTSGPRTAETVEIPSGGEVTRDVRLHAGSISGRVVDAGGRRVGDAIVLVVRGNPPPDAPPETLVRSLAGQAVSAADGTFRVPGLEAGRYVVRAYHEAHAAARTEEVLLSVDEAMTGLEIRLPAPGALVLVVRGPNGPVNEVVVRSRDARGRSPSIVPTERRGEDGRIAIPYLAPGTWRVEVGAEGLAPAVLEGLQVPEQGLAEFTIHLVEGGTVRVEVVDEEDRPVADAALRFEPLDGAPPIRLLTGTALLSAARTTGPDGVAVVPHAPPGRFRVRAGRNGSEEASAEVTVENRAVRTVRIVLSR